MTWISIVCGLLCFFRKPGEGFTKLFLWARCLFLQLCSHWYIDNFGCNSDTVLGIPKSGFSNPKQGLLLWYCSKMCRLNWRKETAALENSFANPLSRGFSETHKICISKNPRLDLSTKIWLRITILDKFCFWCFIEKSDSCIWEFKSEFLNPKYSKTSKIGQDIQGKCKCATF